MAPNNSVKAETPVLKQSVCCSCLFSIPLICWKCLPFRFFKMKIYSIKQLCFPIAKVGWQTASHILSFPNSPVQSNSLIQPGPSVFICVPDIHEQGISFLFYKILGRLFGDNIVSLLPDIPHCNISSRVAVQGRGITQQKKKEERKGVLI